MQGKNYLDYMLKSLNIIWRIDQLEHVAGAVNLPDVQHSVGEP